MFQPVGSNGAGAGSLAVRRCFPPQRLGAVRDGDVESVGILDAEALVVRPVMIGDRFQPALLELGFHLVGVPRLDAPGKAVEDGLHRRPADAESRVGDRRPAAAPSSRRG